MKNASTLLLATRLQLERDELLMPLLHGRTPAHAVRAAVLVRTAGVDGCGLQACRRSDLTLFVTERQICVSYACRQSTALFTED